MTFTGNGTPLASLRVGRSIIRAAIILSKEKSALGNSQYLTDSAFFGVHRRGSGGEGKYFVHLFSGEERSAETQCKKKKKKTPHLNITSTNPCLIDYICYSYPFLFFFTDSVKH